MEGRNMVKTKCVCESFYATDTKGIESFINEFWINMKWLM